MGLVKRGNTWWMSFMFRGQQVRRSTGTDDKRLAEAILGKVKVQIIEGRFFEKPEAQHRTLAELMDRYASEHAARRANHRRELTSDPPGKIWSRLNVRLGHNQGGWVMPKKRDTPEAIIQHLRTVELETGKGVAVLDACRTLGITEQRCGTSF